MKRSFVFVIVSFAWVVFLQGQTVKLLFNNYDGNKPIVKPVKTAIYKKVQMGSTNNNPILKISDLGDIEQKQILSKAISEKIQDQTDESASVNNSPLPFKVFSPGIKQSVDPHIAVGRNYIVITNYDEIGFYDKQGNQLSQKGNGIPTLINADDFFERFFDPVNQEMGLDTKSPAYHINEFYDLRVIYDYIHRRFFLVAAARNKLWKNDPETPDSMEPWSRRLVAFAISKSEDPRDGFYQYMTTENNYRDWPRIGVSGNNVLIANNSEDGMANGPVAYVFSINDIKMGNPSPAGIKLYPSDVFGFTKLNLSSVQDRSFSFSCFLHLKENVLTAIYFENTSQLKAKPSIKFTSVKMSEKIGFLSNGAFIRNSSLYFTYQFLHAPPLGTTKSRFGIRYVKLPLVKTGEIFSIVSSGSGVLEKGFGLRNGQDDHPQDLISYEEPEIAINSRGDFCIGYGRAPVLTKKLFYPEVRYTVFYNNETDHRRSSLLKSGESMPKWKRKEESAERYGPQSEFLHYSSAVTDPADDSFWVIHAYANASNKYQIIVGNIKL